MLLAVDTSTAQVGLALYDEEHVAAEMIWHSHQHHTVEVAPALAELLRRCGASLGDVDVVAVALGPGSFTALRVGMALVKGLALPRKLPIVGIPTLDVLAAGYPASKMPLAAVLQAGRGRIAVGWYRCAPVARERKTTSGAIGQPRWKASEEAVVQTVEELVAAIEEPTIVVGELSADDRLRMARKKVKITLAPLSLCVRRPSVLAELAWARWRAGATDDAQTLAPVYLQFDQALRA